MQSRRLDVRVVAYLGCVEWVLPLPARPGGSDGWAAPQLPLVDELPSELVIEASAVTHPVHPLFAVRLRTFIDWHRARGRTVTFHPDTPAGARRALGPSGFNELFSGPEPLNATVDDDLVVPATRLVEELQVDSAAARIQHLLEYEMTELADFGVAVFQAVSELCSNALQHGRHELGVCYAARRRNEPRRQIDVAIGDLGVGIPEHLRGRHPEWIDDSHAIALALEPGVSGTGDPHRGYGYTHTFEAALTSSLHAARIEIHSGNGYIRREVVQEQSKTSSFPAPQHRRGTLLCWTLTSAGD